jgi:hypothetical protein
VLLLDGEGVVRAVPVAWTDLHDASLEVQLGEGRTAVLVDDLLALVSVIAGMTT